MRMQKDDVALSVSATCPREYACRMLLPFFFLCVRQRGPRKVSFATSVVIILLELFGRSLPRKRGVVVINNLVGRDTCIRQQQRPKLNAFSFVLFTTTTNYVSFFAGNYLVVACRQQVAHDPEPVVVCRQLVAHDSGRVVVCWQLVAHDSGTVVVCRQLVAQDSEPVVVCRQLVAQDSGTVVVCWQLVAQDSEPRVVYWQLVAQDSEPVVVCWQLVAQDSEPRVVWQTTTNYRSCTGCYILRVVPAFISDKPQPFT